MNLDLNDLNPPSPPPPPPGNHVRPPSLAELSRNLRVLCKDIEGAIHSSNLSIKMLNNIERKIRILERDLIILAVVLLFLAGVVMWRSW